MNQMRPWAAAGIIGVAIILMFALSVPHTRDVVESIVIGETASSGPEVTWSDDYKKGVHTISGSIMLKNACTPVVATGEKLGNASTTESILVSLSYTYDTLTCLQLPTKVPFEVKVEADSDLTIDLLVNGSPATSS